MRILFADQFTEPGGAQLCLKAVIADAESRGWMTRLMRPGEGLPASIGCYSNGRKSLQDVFAFTRDTLEAALALRRAVRECQIDVVYVNGPRVLPAAAMAGRPLVFHVHSYLGTRYAREITRLSLRRTRATVLAASKFVADPVIRLACAKEVRVIYNGVADKVFLGRSFSGALTVGMLGRISREKGHLEFVRAAREITNLFPEARFVVYGAPLFSGSEYDAEVRRAATGVGVQFRGWTEDVSTALHEIDILAVPSARIESTPRVILEALSAGTPVVAFPSGGMPEIIRTRQTGMLTAAPNAEALTQAIAELIRNRDLMRWISLNGRCEWERRFTEERFVRAVCDSLAGVVGQELAPNPAQPYFRGELPLPVVSSRFGQPE